jgi:hypothetical protein
VTAARRNGHISPLDAPPALVVAGELPHIGRPGKGTAGSWRGATGCSGGVGRDFDNEVSVQAAEQPIISDRTLRPLPDAAKPARPPPGAA